MTSRTIRPRSTASSNSTGTTGRPGSGGEVTSDFIESRLIKPLIELLVQKGSAPNRLEPSPAPERPATRLGSTISVRVVAAVAARVLMESRPRAASAASAATGNSLTAAARPNVAGRQAGRERGQRNEEVRKQDGVRIARPNGVAQTGPRRRRRHGGGVVGVAPSGEDVGR